MSPQDWAAVGMGFGIGVAAGFALGVVFSVPMYLAKFPEKRIWVFSESVARLLKRWKAQREEQVRKFYGIK